MVQDHIDADIRQEWSCIPTLNVETWLKDEAFLDYISQLQEELTI